MIQKFFNRYEIKYRLDFEERNRIMSHLKIFMKLDPHVERGNTYEVRSLYFDSPFKSLYFEKANGIKLRRKLRIRYYPNSPKSQNLAFVEVKRKINENVSKSRIIVPIEKALEVIDENTSFAKNFYKQSTIYDRETLREIWYLRKRYHLHPACVVFYKRVPYIGKMNPKFRITFDQELRVRNHSFDLLNSHNMIPIISRNRCVMEVKFNDIIPNWAIKIVQRNNCTQNKLSKFAHGLKQTRSFGVV
ncbi:MAG: VTC domain-containing protein [Promethearchaeota archaeon]